MTQQGFFRDPPARQFGYDVDGTVAFFWARTAISGRPLGVSQLTNSEMVQLNNINEDAIDFRTPQFGPSQDCDLVIYFPELRDITHVHANLERYVNGGDFPPQLVNIDYSSDSTNPMDGNWTSLQFNGWFEGYVTPNYREAIDPWVASGIKAMRFRFQQSWDNGGYSGWLFKTLNIYGRKSPGQSPHRVDFVDVSGNDLSIDFDYGDQARNTVRTWSNADTWNQSSGVYVANKSTEKVANTVVVSVESLSTDMSNDVTLSKDNISYGANVTYTTIQPGQVVGPIYVKHTLTGSSTLGLRQGRLKATVASWT